MPNKYEVFIERKRGPLPLGLLSKKSYLGTLEEGQVVECSGGKGAVELKLDSTHETLKISSKAEPLQIKSGADFFTGKPPVTETLGKDNTTEARTGRLRVAINVVGDNSSRLILNAPEPKCCWIRPEQVVPLVADVITGKI